MGARLPEPPTTIPGWSETDLATLAAVFETFVPGSAIRRARLAAAALEEIAAPDDVATLRDAVRRLQNPLANAAQGLGAVRFMDLDQLRRERLLRAAAESRIGARRTFYQALKRLACRLAYADPGSDGQNSYWPRIGYRFPEDDQVAQPLLAPLVVGTGGDVLRLEADVVVVGSGAGGGLVAARLAEAGRSVIVVEAGPWVPEPELPTSELEGYERLFLDRGLTSTSDLGVVMLAGGAVGGGTLVNWATCLEPPGDLRHEWAAQHGLEGFDGSATDADLERLRTELELAPPPDMPPKDRLLLDGAGALGWEAGPTERDATGCGDCGRCTFGCRRGAKRAGTRVHLARAVAAGGRLLAEAAVERVLVEGGRAAGVAGTARLPDGGRRPFVVHAPTVVVAAGALRTPAVLTRSGLRHPAIGEHLRLHPSVGLLARLPGAVEPWRGTTQAARSLHWRAEGFVIEAVPAHPGILALAVPWEGSASFRAVMERVRSMAPLVGIVRDRDAGRVTVTRAGRVRIEYRLSARDAETARRALVAVARLARAGGASEMVALGEPAAWFGREGRPAGVSEEAEWEAYAARLGRFDFSPNRGFLGSAHQMGTARASRDPRAGACDPEGRLRRDTGGAVVAGLYVADASLLPSAPGVNPMLTIMALAERAARAVLADG
ncbi:MAG TPA: GMC family oxidoreductase [Candidatus Limnocylindrales bacterium]|nr:GMC family oxidoreductase [Candidatus Limnocylindrales bacterium]